MNVNTITITVQHARQAADTGFEQIDHTVPNTKIFYNFVYENSLILHIPKTSYLDSRRH